ncbi:hypothetical protein KAR10_06975, partial [bacterium]|nr:hypothetical protein [bacterium]
SGFGDSTEVEYRDVDDDGIYDLKAERYGRIEGIDHSYTNDIYLAFGMRGLYGFDLGGVVRADWESHRPTFNPHSGDSFDLEAWEREYAIISNNEIFRFDQTQTGSLDYGISTWRILGAARSKSLMPNLEVVANIGPIIQFGYNEYEYEKVENTDTVPGNPSLISDLAYTYKESGIEPDAILDSGINAYPGNGFGGLVDVRMDYTLQKNVIVTAKAGYEFISRDVSEKEQLRSTWKRSRLTNGAWLEVDETNTADNDIYEGDLKSTFAALSLRAQYLFEGWKLALGAGASSSGFSSEITRTNQYASTQVVSGTGDPLANFTAITTGGSTVIEKNEMDTDTFEFPAGLVLELLDNLVFRFGVKHSITVQEHSTSEEVLTRTPTTTATTNGNNETTHTVVDVIGASDAIHESTVTVMHTNHFHYGASWWPFPQVQIDIASYYNVLRLDNYRLSMSFHF